MEMQQSSAVTFVVNVRCARQTVVFRGLNAMIGETRRKPPPLRLALFGKQLQDHKFDWVV